MISSFLNNPLLPPLRAGEILNRVSWQGGGLATGGPIPVVRWSDDKAFQRTGSRQSDTPRIAQHKRLDQAACAALLDASGDPPDELHDLIWATCEQSHWWFSSHGHSLPIDLLVAMNGMMFALIESALGPRLDPEVRERMAREVRVRVLDPFLDPPGGKGQWWSAQTHNWNAVCHAGVGISAMVYEKDAARLDAVFEKIAADLPRFLDGFADDGGCSEGPGYWRYGVLYFALLAHFTRRFTNGALDFAANPKWARVATYPVTATVAPGYDLTFSDTPAAHTPLPLAAASLMRGLVGNADLFSLCEFHEGKPVAREFFDLLTLPAEWPAFDPAAWRRDARLPSLAIAKLFGADGLALGVKAGHNNEHHNHNDIGSFLLFQDGAQWFSDPGRPRYSANTFNHRRYDSVFTCSRGHNVPVVDGRFQQAGEHFRGTLEVLATGVEKRAVVEMAGAYDAPGLKRLTRVLSLSTAEPVLRVDDTFEFDGAGLPVRGVFITLMDVEQRSATEVALLHPNGKTGVLRALSPGAFSVEVLHGESAESVCGQLLRRISFTPEKVLPVQTLSFRFEAQQ